MSRFQEFDPNPFRVNAFTFSGVPTEEVLPRNIKELVTARREEIEGGKKISIPAGNGKMHPVTIADLNRAQPTLLDPTARLAEELLVPASPPAPEFDEMVEFRERYTLSRAKVVEQ